MRNQIKIAILLIALIAPIAIIGYSLINTSHFQDKLDNRVGLTDMKDFIVTDPSGLHTDENLPYVTKNMLIEHLALVCGEDWCNGDWMVQFNNITCYNSKNTCFLEMSFINNENERNIKDKTCSITYSFVDSFSFFRYEAKQPILKTQFYDLVDQCIKLSIKSIDLQTMLTRNKK